MKNDSKSCPVAEVDVANARFSKNVDMGVEFTNEIDVWTQMEFRARHQIKHLKQYGYHQKTTEISQIYNYFYGTRHFF